MNERNLLARLEASDCALCKEAAEYIRAQNKAHREEIRELERDAREDARQAVAEARWQAREEAEGNGGW